ncbi:MAG: hypothetical protein IKA36_06710 [Clostridia bacterium]|nr:hypothetical protein [Clostridia bacterium]
MITNYDSEAIVKIYRMLSKKCDVIDRFINNHAYYFGPYTEEFGASDVCNNIIDLITRKNQLINLKIIVDNAINGDKKVDLKPFEKTLNKFLTSIEEKFVSQQEKINSLESKLEGLMTIIEEKDTAQLTKKVGGMDRQIAKLNKSIEKIASHVVEK